MRPDELDAGLRVEPEQVTEDAREKILLPAEPSRTSPSVARACGKRSDHG